jgi:hypothetical protein
VKASIVIVGVAAAVLAGCGGIGGGASASSNTAARTSPIPGRGAFANGNAVTGQVVQLATDKVTVNGQVGNGKTGNTTVSYDSTTTVLQSGTGSMADVVPGVCVLATGQKDATSGVVTATTFQAQLNMNGNCALPAGAGGGQGRPSASPGQGFGGPPGGNLTVVRGKVTSVSGSTVMVQPDAGAVMTVTVPSTVQVTRLVSSTTARLAVGLCVTATGQRDSSGVVKARNILISAPGPNGCTRAGGFGGGFGGGGRGRPSASPGAQSA